jgi:anaerobic ribonucleoside-triphosphate reductase activating protein
MKTELKIAGIVKNSIVDGPGIRYAIFAQGCPLDCPDCHNPGTHDPRAGTLIDISKIAVEIKKDPLLDGVTFTGGEPFGQADGFSKLADLIEGYSIVCYTGYTFEELYAESHRHMLLNKIDVLIDGRFERAQKSFELRFRGSTNQRVIDCKESVKRGKAIEINL